MEKLTEENFLLYAMQHYDNSQCTSIDDFYDDLLKIKYVRRLFKRYHETGELRERLILNHLIILSNVFGVEASVRMLFFKIDRSLWPILKTFLLYLNFMPKFLEDAPDVNDMPVIWDIVKVLRDI